MGYVIKARSHASWESTWSPNSATVGVQKPRGRNLVVSGPQRSPWWELCKISKGMGSCYNGCGGKPQYLFHWFRHGVHLKEFTCTKTTWWDIAVLSTLSCGTVSENLLTTTNISDISTKPTTTHCVHHPTLLPSPNKPDVPSLKPIFV